MESRVNYMISGAFILFFSAALIGFVFWMNKYGYEKQEFDLYRVYLKESVSGLNVESPVKYKGVEVGSVSDIKINPKNSEEIEIRLQIEKDTPIKENNLAVLGSKGITGIKYIEIIKDSCALDKESPLIQKNDEGYRVIRSGKSLFGKLEDSAMTITEKIDGVLMRVNTLLNEKNLRHFEKILENTEESTKYISQKRNEIDVIMAQFTKLMSDENLMSISKTLTNLEDGSGSLNQSAEKFSYLMDNDLKTTLKEITLASKDTKALMQKISGEIDSGKFDIKQISEESLERLNEVMLEIRKTLHVTQGAIESLEDSPSDILFKEREIKYGPGEKDDKND